MHHHHFFLFSFFLTFALPSFATPFRFNRNHFLKKYPSPVEGSVTLSVKDSKPDKRLLFVVPFHSFFVPSNSRLEEWDVKKIAQASHIFVQSVENVKGTNTDDDLVTLEKKDIACQCFNDTDGRIPLGVYFTIPREEEGSLGYPIPKAGPNAVTIQSIFCTDALGLNAYFEKLSQNRNERIERRSISSQLFANLSFGLTADHTDAEQVLVPLTGDPVLGKWSASSVNMASVVDANGNDVDGKGGLCQVLLEGDDVPLDVRVGSNVPFGDTLKTVKSVTCVDE
ncbi:MAG: hypothetical protein LQ341_005384 [Variospora aurantia]|nr:MAG: hypothetical protein LQ341_005384 [Variospora aurantia]